MLPEKYDPYRLIVSNTTYDLSKPLYQFRHRHTKPLGKCVQCAQGRVDLSLLDPVYLADLHLTFIGERKKGKAPCLAERFDACTKFYFFAFAYSTRFVYWCVLRKHTTKNQI